MIDKRVALAFAILVACGCNSSGVPGTAGAPGISDADFSRPWVYKDRVASGKPIDAIVGGPAGYVAITHAPTLDGKGMPARNNIAAISTDGVSWSETPILPDGHYFSITYGAGRYFAAGGQAPGGGPGRIIASTDGRTWTEVATASSVLRRIRFTEAGFIAVGIFGGITWSPDGAVWTEAADGGRGMLWDVAFGAGRFVAVGLTLSVGSSDGRQWSQLACGTDLPCMNVVDPSGIGHGILQLYGVHFGNGAFVAHGVAGLLRSSDGLRWSKVGDAGDPLGYAGGQFIALRPHGAPGSEPATTFDVSVSADAQTWTDRTTARTVQTDDTCLTGRCWLLPAGLLIVPPAPAAR